MKIISLKKEQLLFFLYVTVIAVGIVASYRNQTVETFSMPISGRVIMIDAGHGGWDPGKVGNQNILEKDINLQIAQKLQMYLEQAGSIVILSRLDDTALSDKKRNDMYSRADIANTSNADIFVSIHQNSYPDASVRGAQVFYYENSEKSRILAESIQNELLRFVDPYNKRTVESNTNYYVLKRTTIPAVIVECGFLSNDGEKWQLMDENYQERIAWGIYLGIINYFMSLEMM